MNFPSISPNGECQKNTRMIKYLKNEEVSCSYKFFNDLSNCENYNINNILHKENIVNLFSGIDPVSNTISKIEQKINFEKIYNRFYTTKEVISNYPNISVFNYYQLSPSSPYYCSCSNIITGVNYNFYVNKTSIVDSEITYLMDNISGDCDKDMRIPISYKISFMGYNKVIEYKFLKLNIFTNLFIYANSFDVSFFIFKVQYWFLNIVKCCVFY